MTAVLQLEDITVDFPVGSRLAARLSGRPQTVLRAVDRVSLDVETGEALAVVGESGCGKSTLARTIVGLQTSTGGSLTFEGRPMPNRRSADLRRRIQMVFQDPGSSLNPALTVQQTIAEVLEVHGLVDKPHVDARCHELMSLVELPTALLSAYPRRLSGGQRQRVAIARALAAEPDLLIADEAVAALDVSVQAAVLNLLRRLHQRLGLTLVFISHDLAVVRNLCERVAVMYLGKLVEEGDTERVFSDPRHPYTRALLAAAPRIGAKKRPGESVLSGEPPSPLDLPVGCRFHPRCPLAADVCRSAEPDIITRDGHGAACHFAWETPAVASPGAGDSR